VMLQRLKTGIPGLDEMVNGGFPIPSTALVAGEPGTGKTTFSVQSLFYGATCGEKGLYITAISEPQWVVQKFLSTFAFYDQEVVEREDVVFCDVSSVARKNPSMALEKIKELVEIHEPKRIVIDPITPFLDLIDSGQSREFMHNLFSTMKAFNAVSVVTAEMAYANIPHSLEGYMVDSVVVLSYPEEERVRRKYIEVLKMRGTRHTTGRQLLDISSSGMQIQVGLR